MSNSALATVKVWANSTNYSKGRSGYKIKKITIHHMAGILTAKECGRIFQAYGYGASTHYGVGKDGKIGQYVDEANTPYSDANWVSNCTSVTIETSNSARGGSWPVSDKSLQLLIKLCADIAKRNNLGKLVVGKNLTLTYHSMYCATTCPGDYLRSKMQYIADEANKINYPSTAAKVNSSVLYRVRKSWADSKSQLGAYAKLTNAQKVAKKNKGYKVYDGSGKCVYDPWTTTSFKVKVTAKDLNIRTGPGTNYKSKGYIKPGVYTIVQTSGKWGKLKSGAGWIHLDYAKRL